jgi:predicted DNA-binding transcriptional regulator YafY
MSTTINKKINHIYLLLEKLANGEELYPQNPRLQSELDVNERTLRRYLEDIYTLYSHIVVTKKIPKEFSDRKVTVYKVVDKEKDISAVFKFFLNHSDDLSWLLQLAYENNPKLLRDFKDENRESLEKLLKEDEDIFLFVGSPFESMDDNKFLQTFSQLKTAVKNHEYRDILYGYEGEEYLKNLKCLKLIHTDNNWYIAVETSEEVLRLLRVAFIEQVVYSKGQSSFHKSILNKYSNYFKNMKNAMSLNKP